MIHLHSPIGQNTLPCVPANSTSPDWLPREREYYIILLVAIRATQLHKVPLTMSQFVSYRIQVYIWLQYGVYTVQE